MIHELKCWPEHFMAIERGAKTCELRLNDRNYQVDDTLLLREWEPLENAYTGAECRATVTHILSGGVWLTPGYIAMSIEMTDEPIDRAVIERVHALFMQKLAVEYPDHPWLKKGSVMTTQAQPPTDAEQVRTLRTANALLRERVKEQEQIAVMLRSELENAHKESDYWRKENRAVRDAAAATIEEALTYIGPAAVLECERNSLKHELDELRSVIAALQIERDMLKHRLGEAHQTMTTMEETQ